MAEASERVHRNSVGALLGRFEATLSDRDPHFF
ncbi:hypothetical protein CA54_19400 [Symmachiella macrocystis]|uniref:Uncharacterized protein n=1 Tax=Symmachiella macrocystis TaxID=2527985 RepID=A0A5C6BR28_9PLAN|nr:hypothetical protein CA54_19400 [Symmachiella macrocystis]